MSTRMKPVAPSAPVGTQSRGAATALPGCQQTTLATRSGMLQPRETKPSLLQCCTTYSGRISSRRSAGERGRTQAWVVGSWPRQAAVGHSQRKKGAVHPAPPQSTQQTRGTRGRLERVKRSRGLLLSRGKSKDVAHGSCGLGGHLLLGSSASAQQGKIHPASSPESLSNRHVATVNSKRALHPLHPIPSLLPAAPAQKGSMQSVSEVLCHEALSCLLPSVPGSEAAAQERCC